MWIDKDFITKCLLIRIPEPGIVFGFPDCTLFAQSGAKHDRDGDEMEYALSCAKMVKEVGDYFSIPWMIENPVGKMSNKDKLGKPDFYFNPRDFGGHLLRHEESFHEKMPRCDNYTKKTCIWHGNGFVEPEKFPAPDDVDGCNFFWGWKYLGGKSSRTKQLRSLTPRGFARAVFKANFK